MGFFSTPSQFDGDVEKATNETNVVEEWGKIMDICDKVGNSSQNAKDCLRSIVKRLNAQDPHIVIQAITLLDACSSNCGKTFHLEIASREFEGELKKLIAHSEPKIVTKFKALLKKWAEGDFKTDPQLNLIPSLYNKLRSEGIDFSNLSETSKHLSSSRDANTITDPREEEDIAKAIELSLKENQQHRSVSTSHSSPISKKNGSSGGSLYPNVSSALNATSTSAGRTVRALYDFEAAEDNELTFLTGELIHIIDDSDPNWWKGRNHRGEGLFPSNFVTADLSVEPEQFTKLEHNTKKSVQFSEEVEVKTVKREPEVNQVEVVIDERKMERLLDLLHEADPQCYDGSDSREMLELEEQVTAMGPLIDAALEKVDRRHAQLTQLSADLVDALNLYHTLMREPPSSAAYAMPKLPGNPTSVATSPATRINPYPFPNQGSSPAHHMFNGMPPPPPPPPPPPTSLSTSFNPPSGGAAPYGEYMSNMSLPVSVTGQSQPQSVMPQAQPQQQHFPVQQPGQHRDTHPLPANPATMSYQPRQPYPPAGQYAAPATEQRYAPTNGQRTM